MPLEYLVKQTGRGLDATISENGNEIARLRHRGAASILEANGDGHWTLNPRVNGEIRPFSFEVTLGDASGPRVLTIQNHVFIHRGAFYMLMGVPEHVHPADHMLGRRYIIRLDKFPFSSLDEVDRETWGRLRRLRGVPVAEIQGLGLNGHTIEVSQELAPIGLVLAAASYLLYSTA